jgi:nitroreductase
MKILESILKRRSMRTFTSTPVTKEAVEKIIDCARLAPTARNVQPWEFIAITHKETLQKIASLVENGRFIKECACCIAVACSDTKYYLEDGCAATENILLAATELELASCWVAGDKKDYCDAIKRLLDIPEHYKLVSLIPIGFSNATSSAPSKRSLSEILHWEKF